MSEDFEIEKSRSEKRKRMRELDWNEKSDMIDRMSSLILKSDYLIENLLRIVCNEFQKDLKIRLMFKIRLEMIHIMNEMIALNSTRRNALRDVCKSFVMSKNSIKYYQWYIIAMIKFDICIKRKTRRQRIKRNWNDYINEKWDLLIFSRKRQILMWRDWTSSLSCQIWQNRIEIDWFDIMTRSLNVFIEEIE